MNNIPQVKMGIIAVSRDCFPITLSDFIQFISPFSVQLSP